MLIGYKPSEFLKQVYEEFTGDRNFKIELWDISHLIEEKRIVFTSFLSEDVFLELDDIILRDGCYYQTLKWKCMNQNSEMEFKKLLEIAMDEFEPVEVLETINTEPEVTTKFYFKDYPIQQPEFEVDPALTL